MALGKEIFKSQIFGKLGVLGFFPVWLDESLTSYSLCTSSYFLVMKQECIYYIVSKFTALKYKPNKCIYLPK